MGGTIYFNALDGTNWQLIQALEAGLGESESNNSTAKISYNDRLLVRFHNSIFEVVLVAPWAHGGRVR